MAKSKYSQGKDGYYAARVWDGSRDEFGRKHYLMLRTRKSSKELERMVAEYNARVASGQFVKSSDALFLDYCREWLRTYKAVRERNTQAMYANIIRKHFAPLADVRVADLRKTHLQLIINSALDKPRTCQQIRMTFRQIVNAAIDDKENSDLNRNLYLDLQEQTRQDRSLEARAGQLEQEAAQLNMLIMAVIAAIVLLAIYISLLTSLNAFPIFSSLSV